MIDLSGDNHVARAPGDNSKYGVVLTWVNGYWWNGVPQQVGAYGTACNAMYVIDRSGDATVNRATADFVRDFNTLSNAIGRTCRFPVLVHSIQNQYVGQCARATWNFQGYSFTTLCRQPIPNPNSRGTSIAYTAGAGISHYQPNTFIQRDFADYNTTYSHVGHELSHAMGLDHSPEPSSLMYPFITTGVKKGYNTGDLVALAAWYDTHVGP
ncbi:MAG: matrixin family metalloprotease [Lysobacterales bacterium]